MFNRVRNTGDDWKSVVEDIKAAKTEFERGQSIMSPHERQMYSTSIQQKISGNFKRVYQGMEAQIESAISNYKYNVAKRNAARSKEINSWDTGKLLTETQAFQQQVDMVLKSNPLTPFGANNQAPVERVKQLFQEAQASGNAYKKRAAAEVIDGINTDKMPKETAVSLRMLGREAAAMLAELRTNAEIQEAEKSEAEAAMQLMREREAAIEVGEMMNDESRNIFANGAFVKLAKQIKVDGDGTLRLLEKDDPEITGIHWSTDPGTIEALKGENNG